MAEWSPNEDLAIMAEADKGHAERYRAEGNPRAAAAFERSARECRAEILKRKAQGKN